MYMPFKVVLDNYTKKFCLVNSSYILIIYKNIKIYKNKNKNMT